MDSSLSMFYTSWMDKAEGHEQSAKVMDDAKKYDVAIVLYQKAISSYQRATKFTHFDEDKQEIHKTCQEITNRIKIILSQNKDLQSKYNYNDNESDESDTDNSDDDDDEEKKHNNDVSITMQIISDIHLEFDGIYDKMPKINNNEHKASILALLGDIGYPKLDIYKQFIAEMSKQFKYILIIAGNHEYYKDEMYNVHSILTQMDHTYENVFFLHKRSIEFPDLSPNIRFIGTTLWVHYPKKIQYEAALCVNDFHLIQINETQLKQDIHPGTDDTKKEISSSQADIEGKKEEEVKQKLPTEHNNEVEQDEESFMLAELMGEYDDSNVAINIINTKNDEWGKSWQKNMMRKRRLNVDDINSLHQDQLEWIKQEIIRAKKDKKKLIILTHHSPTSYKCISPTDEMENVSFVMSFSSLEKWFKYPVICWAFGHTHWNCDFMVVSEKGKHKKTKWFTRVVSNQLGYYDDQSLLFEAKDYSIQKIITLPNKEMNHESDAEDDCSEFIDKQTLREKVQYAKERIAKLS